MMDKLTARNMVMDSVQVADLMSDRFPLTISYLSESRKSLFNTHLDMLRLGVIGAAIVIKSKAAEVSSGLSSRFDEAFRNSRAVRQYLDIERESRPEWFTDAYYANGLRSIKKIVKVCKPYAGDAIADDVLALCAEWEPIVSALDALKGKVTTAGAVREEKKEAAVRAKLSMPPSKLSPIVSAAVDAKKPELAESYREFVAGVFKSLVAKFGPEFKEIANSHSYKTYQNTVKPVLGADKQINKAALDRKANEYAEQVGEAMKEKIMAKAGELDSPEVKRMNGYSFMITGKRLGHDVVIEQTMIVNVSKLGTLFNQWPARIRLDGRAMSEAAYKGIK